MMKKMFIDHITKLIPFNIRIKTLYWVIKEKEIDSDLSVLFSKIDHGEYISARYMLEDLKTKWIEFSYTSPKWFVNEYIPQFTKAEAILNFLQVSLKD